MKLYQKEERLNLKRIVRVTEKEYELLKAQKKKQGISMAKIVCNLIIDKYGTHI